jgi:hypothetical protein
MATEHERLDADVLIIGAGPGGLACALHLANLIEKHTAAKKSPELSAENIYVLEKAREIGAHQLSGAIMDPRGLRELVLDFEKTAPLDTPITGDAAYYFTEKGSWKFPITPPPLAQHGNYIVSLNKLVKWLGGLVEKKGVNLFTQFAGKELLYDKNGIAGVMTEDKGVDKNGKPKDNFTPGYELRAKVTVLAEGPRGSLTKDLVGKLKLDGLNPQAYGIGIRNCGTCNRDESRPDSPRTRWAGRWIRACTAAAGFTGCATTVCRWGWWWRSSTTIRCSIRTRHSRNSRRIPTCEKFWKAGSWCAMARRPFRTAAGIPCRAATWMAD